MSRSLSSAALANLVFAGALLALGGPAFVASMLRLPGEATVGALERGVPVSQERLTAARGHLEAATRFSDSARADLGFVLLASASPARAAAEFRTYLAGTPADSRAWAGLAEAELLQGRSDAAAAALRMSILTGPSLPELVLWRCGFGADLYPTLSDDDRALLAGQYRLAVVRSADRLAKLLRRRHALFVALVLLADSPDSVQTLMDAVARAERG